ncbi:hypothetical protein ICY_02129 [Bacillus cereus BAG2X1-3]|nr:hypothetical protein ICU_02285 [Bacillus cereus BAG2X1-1]EJS76661.1 hypothetical protein ICY_02129 [Bacillus cereus BAG2X1-3]
MNLQHVEQIESETILNILQHAVGPNEISLNFIKAMKGHYITTKKKLV